jgi:phenylacetate-coenzyme A ligase PaaK-like adenylate-forming protein
LTWWLAGQRIGYVGAVGGHFAGVANMRRMARLAARWPAWCVPQVQELSVLDPLPEIAQALQASRPSVLVTYPSCAAALARLAAGGSLAIAPRETWLGGEQLSAAGRRVIEAAFGTTRSGYGASEFFSIAWECSSQRLHVNEDWVILEPVDAQGRAVEPGETSHALLLTNLANTVQPLIRYRLADRVRWRGRGCACGSRLPVIEVEGRDDDTLLLRDAHQRPVAMLPMALATVLEDEAGLTRFQLLRLGPATLELRLDASELQPDAAFARADAALRRYLGRHGLANVSVRRGERPLHAATRSGKLRRVLAHADA